MDVASTPSSMPWSPERRWLRRAAVAIGVALLVCGAWLWWSSTQPADPLNRYPGFGFEGTRVTGVPVGQGRAFVVYLVGDTRTSRATITRVILPRIPGVRLRMYAVIGRSHGQVMGTPISATPNPHELSADQLVPLVGRSLHPPPAGFQPDHWMLSIALAVTPLRPGCHRVTDVAIRYRVGDTTFTKAMAGAISVSTDRRTCT